MADERMPKILYIGFGMEPFMRGGAITYQYSLMNAIRDRGWKVVFFLAVPRYTLLNRPGLKTWYRNGIKTIELVNPPYHYAHRHSPIFQCRHSDIEKLTRKVLEVEKPDLVHIHELQFHTASVIDILDEMSIPSLKTLHNYYDLCPEGNLMYNGRELCTDYEGGKRCSVCMENRPIYSKSLAQKFLQVLPLEFSDWLYRYYRAVFGYKTIFGKKITVSQENAFNGPASVKSIGPEHYAYRREFFVERLNKLRAVHFSSHRTSEILVKHRLKPEKSRIIPLSVKGQERISPKPLRGNGYPVVFGYIGGNYRHKGCHVLLEAFSVLDQKKARLIIWGAEKSDIAHANLNVEYRSMYEQADISRVLGAIDVCIVPSIWEEIFGIIGIECRMARVPVIGSRIGGIPEWLRDGENGFFVKPDDPQELAMKMEWFLKNPAMIGEMQARIEPWKSFVLHCDEMTDLYQSIMR